MFKTLKVHTIGNFDFYKKISKNVELLQKVKNTHILNKSILGSPI